MSIDRKVRDNRKLDCRLYRRSKPPLHKVQRTLLLHSFGSRACADLKLFNQEVLRVIPLDTRQRLITMIDVTKGSLNESLAYPRDIFRPVIVHSAYSFILAHNKCGAAHLLCELNAYVVRRRGSTVGKRCRLDLGDGPTAHSRFHSGTTPFVESIADAARQPS